MHYRHIVLDMADRIATLTLNRPERLNSFTKAMHLEVRAALAAVQADTRVRVLLLTGAGRGFCAGQDLDDEAVDPAQGAVDLGAVVDQYYAPLVLALRDLPMPVVCAVNGVAAGAGVNLALACDIVLAAQSASFIQPFCQLGLLPDTGGTYFLPRLIGSARASGLALLGETLGAEQAAQWGLIWRCVPDQELAAEAAAIARHFAAAPTLGLASTKQALQASATNSLAQQLALEGKMMTRLGCSADYREAMAAFRARRAPSFTGQ